MKTPTVYVFFNAEGVVFPAGATWNKFQHLQDARMFNVCVESWRRQGWDVRRLATTGDFPRTKFLPDGRCARQGFHWYPETYWQFLAAACWQASIDDAWRIFVTIDVINYGFRPEHFAAIPEELGRGGYIGFQREHLTFACFAANLSWLRKAETMVQAYDRGDLPDLNRDVCDEYIVRAFTKDPAIWPLATFPSNVETLDFPLSHHGRSTLKHVFDSVPL